MPIKERKTGKCSNCGNDIVDPYCEEACPKHLCGDCGIKCLESLPANVNEWPDPDKCEECPYDVDPEDLDDVFEEPPGPEELEELAEEMDRDWAAEEDLW